MKNFIKINRALVAKTTKLFTLLLAVAASVGTMFAEKVQIGDLYYNLDATNQTAEVTSQESNYWSTSITTANIPASVEYNSIPYSVTSIGDNAFYGCDGLTSVTIPNSVTSIGGYAFLGCSKLTSVTIPNSVTSIGSYAFYYCSGLTSVTIPNSVTSIGSYAFYYCSGLTSVTIPNSVTSIGQSAFSGCIGLTSIDVATDNPNYSSSGGVLFNKGKTTLVAYPGGKQGAYTIPNSVTSIGNRAFYDCSGLTSVTIGNSVTGIGDYAFWNCNKLTSLTIPNSVVSIGGSAFSDCTGLTSVIIGNSVTSIGDEAFRGCTGLTSIEIPNSVTSLDGSVFCGCSNLVSLKLPKNLEDRDIYDYLIISGLYRNRGGTRDAWDNNQYAWLRNLVYIEAPAWFFDVPETDLAYCPKHLQNVIVNNGELTESAFNAINQSYKTLQTLDISAVTNTELTDEAFKNCYSITELKLPSNTEHIGYMSVAECVKLQSIDIPTSVEVIEDRAFENCRSLKTITFGGSSSPVPGRFEAPAVSASQLQRIGNWAFYNCHELQNLTIPEGVTEIGDGAFYGCTYLEDLTLPSSVHAIGDNTFALCAKMKKIIVNAPVPPTIQAKTFFDVKRQIPVYVPDEVVDAYKDDTYWGEFDIQGVSHMPLGIDDVESGVKAQKLLRDNQVLILRGDKTYTVTGQEIK